MFDKGSSEKFYNDNNINAHIVFNHEFSQPRVVDQCEKVCELVLIHKLSFLDSRYQQKALTTKFWLTAESSIQK